MDTSSLIPALAATLTREQREQFVRAALQAAEQQLYDAMETSAREEAAWRMAQERQPAENGAYTPEQQREIADHRAQRAGLMLAQAFLNARRAAAGLAQVRDFAKELAHFAQAGAQE